MNVNLNDKYVLNDGIRFLTGSQALVRLPIVQIRKDKRNNINTAAYISGYRGSPLGGYDQQLLKNIEYLNSYNINFQPGINEELAATSLWGTQQANFYGEGKYDGVFGIWYGKGPGVDRSGDALKHVNLAGTSKYGGVLALMGDDHICESSTTSHQSEFAMIDAMIPIFNPSGVQEILDYGLYGFSLSRMSGCWIGIKCVHDNVSSAATIDLNENRFNIYNVDKSFFLNGDLNIRLNDTPQAKEHRLHYDKIKVVKEFCRINKLNKLIADPNNAKIGIVTTGKSFLDTKLALEKLEILNEDINKFNLKLLKIAMPWPLEESIIIKFAEGLDSIIVVEEKRSLIEYQIKDILFNINKKINILGKYDLNHNIFLPSSGSLDPGIISLKLGKFINNYYNSELLNKKVKLIESSIFKNRTSIDFKRTPYFCSGCPHSTSTQIPENSRAITGISCAYLVQGMERNNQGFTQMGSEGASWVGESIFTKRDHIFQNMGDGTYIHSGILSIRHAVAAKTKITFKILYNDAVALTGGQSLDGLPTVPQLSKQLESEGVKQIAIISNEPDKYSGTKFISKKISIHHRKNIIKIQIEFSKINGTTAIIYDQTCAAEKRRRIKKKLIPKSLKKIFINDLVCEGCGDCGIKSNCVSIIPKETELGRKRQIDQYSCNHDFSCIEGFCPSFVSLKGNIELKKISSRYISDNYDNLLVAPTLPKFKNSYNIMIAGIGGTGVVTIGAILGTAAQIEGKGSGVLDMTGLAQKGGSVKSFLKIFKKQDEISAIRLSYNETNLLLGCDIVVSNDEEVLLTINPLKTKAIINSDEVITGEFTRNVNFSLPIDKIKENLINLIGLENINFIPTTTIVKKILGDSITSNMFMVGLAYQSGFIPLNYNSILKAIKLNGVSVDLNIKAFNLGRYSFYKKENLIENINKNESKIFSKIEDKKNMRYDFLVNYQNTDYAKKYENLIKIAKTCEKKLNTGISLLSEAVTMNYFKLMSYKDEYEISRLYTDSNFLKKINNTFEGKYKIEYNLSPPIFSKKDPITKLPIKKQYGSWIYYLFKFISFFKFIRGTYFDPFSYLDERKIERKLIYDYEKLIKDLCLKISNENYNLAVEIAKIPDQINGFGYIKMKNIENAKKIERSLILEFNEKK